jgi:hypothetical protein
MFPRRRVQREQQMHEAFLAAIKTSNQTVRPQFTSCCPLIKGIAIPIVRK